MAPPNTDRDTKTAILDSAETLMAEHGIEGVSLRQILAHAKANSAALHYHFGSREALIEAILARRGIEANQRRREMLDALEAREQPPGVRDVVDAVIDPMLEIIDKHGEAGRRFIRFLSRLQADRTGIIQGIEEQYFPDVIGRIGRMLRDACPQVSDGERARRVMMMLDAMLPALASADPMTQEWSGRSDSIAIRDYAESLKDFLVGGLSAPVTKRGDRT